jgi:hypothetical protein
MRGARGIRTVDLPASGPRVECSAESTEVALGRQRAVCGVAWWLMLGKSTRRCLT